mmetsp:Transcript_7454/g.14898  ORF Transcript_7454/g.14898 Transcript_7454/m.14898 type:complete len:133 (-) Transcript_7454:46-444(-)
MFFHRHHHYRRWLHCHRCSLVVVDFDVAVGGDDSDDNHIYFCILRPLRRPAHQARQYRMTIPTKTPTETPAIWPELHSPGAVEAVSRTESLASLRVSTRVDVESFTVSKREPSVSEPEPEPEPVVSVIPSSS